MVIFMEDATIGFFAESTYAAVFFLVPIFRILIPRNCFIVLLFVQGSAYMYLFGSIICVRLTWKFCHVISTTVVNQEP